MSFQLEVDAKSLKKSFALKSIRSIEPPLRGFANYLEKEHQAQFDKEVDPNGVRWARLKKSTLRRKKGSKILTETGALRRSTKAQLVGKNVVRVTAGASYAIFHQLGTRKMAARVIIGITLERKRKAAKLIKGYVKGRGRR